MRRKFTARASEVLELAESQARQFNHGYIGTEHVLLGLLKEASGGGTLALAAFGVSAMAVEREIEQLIQHGPENTIRGKLPLTPRANQAIEFADREAALLNHPRIDSDHLLLGLLREPEGVASQVLRNLGVDMTQVREEVFRTQLAQFRIVERAIRPVRASLSQKRKMREELLAHLTSIYDEEQNRLNDAAAALTQAQRRFGDPAELARELDGALGLPERVGYYIERWFGWRAPENAYRFMLRAAAQSFAIIGAICLVPLAVAIFGSSDSTWPAMRPLAAALVIAPIAQFLLGLLYYKMRDALCGAFWARKSGAKVLLFDALIALVTFGSGLAFVALAAWDSRRAAELVLPFGVGGLVAAIILLLLARFRGPGEISDATWASLDIAQRVAGD